MSDLGHIKAGDQVWLESGNFRTIKTVAKTTRIYIIIGEGKTRQMYERLNGRPHGYASGHITGVATPAEIAQWEEDRARVTLAHQMRAQAELERDNVRRELTALLPYFRVESGDDSKLWNLVLVDRTEEQIREIAAALKGVQQ